MEQNKRRRLYSGSELAIYIYTRETYRRIRTNSGGKKTTPGAYKDKIDEAARGSFDGSLTIFTLGKLAAGESARVYM